MTKLQRYNSVGIGLETLFNRLDALQDSTAVNYPPYNIVVRDEETHELEIALAGWSREDIEVVTERNVLSVSAAAVVKSVSTPTRVSLHVPSLATGNSLMTPWLMVSSMRTVCW